MEEELLRCSKHQPSLLLPGWFGLTRSPRLAGVKGGVGLGGVYAIWLGAWLMGVTSAAADGGSRDARQSFDSQLMKMDKVAVRRWKSGRESAEWDVVAEEAPLEIRVSASFKAQRFIRTLAVTMRTPGHDEDLVAGLLYGEALIRSQDDITLLSRGGDGAMVADLAPWADVDWTDFDRSLPLLSSSCGVCGKRELPKLGALQEAPTKRVRARVITSLVDQLEALQEGFAQTGGLHAAALFDWGGAMKRFREDVGRHNALDKLIGSMLKDGAMPLAESILLMTSRASYDILQKAIRAGIPLVATVGSPSSAAIELAEQRQITLVGFLRGERFNVYAGSWRLID